MWLSALIKEEKIERGQNRQDVEAAKVRDDTHGGVRDEQDRNRLFEAVTEVQTVDDSPARPKRSAKPTPRCSHDDNSPNDYSLDDYSPDDYKPNDYSQEEYSPDDYKPIDYGQDDYSPSDYKPDDYSPDDYDLNCVKVKPRIKSRRSIERARGSPR